MRWPKDKMSCSQNKSTIQRLWYVGLRHDWHWQGTDWKLKHDSVNWGEVGFFTEHNQSIFAIINCLTKQVSSLTIQILTAQS